MLTIRVLIFDLLVTNVSSFFNLTFKQTDYQIKFDWYEVLRYDKDDIKLAIIHVFKFNRTCTAANLTVEYNVDVGRKLMMVIQGYKFASNEYRQFPIRFQISYCDAMENNITGAKRSMECGNSTGCLINKGILYHVCNYVPDPFQFPPFVPTGKYKMEIQGLLHDKELWVVNAYGEIFRPIPWV